MKKKKEEKEEKRSVWLYRWVRNQQTIFLARPTMKHGRGRFMLLLSSTKRATSTVQGTPQATASTMSGGLLDREVDLCSSGGKGTAALAAKTRNEPKDDDNDSHLAYENDNSVANRGMGSLGPSSKVP